MDAPVATAASRAAAAGAPLPCFFHSVDVRRHAGGAHRCPPRTARHARCGWR